MGSLRRFAPALLAAFALLTVAVGASAALARTLVRRDAAQSELRDTFLWSRALGRRVRVLVYLPAGYWAAKQRRYPTLYLLHGTPGEPEDFVGLGLVGDLDSEIADGDIPPLIAVLPTGGPTPQSDTEWADSAVHPSQRWGTFLSRDLVRWTDSRYRTLATRAHRAIAGISMGGFGAVNLALRHRDLFGAASIWSGYFEANTPSVEGSPGSPAWDRDSPLQYVPTLKPSLHQLPLKLSFYSGESDRFYPENVQFHELLSRLGVQHRFESVPGGHDSTLWRSRLAQELRWIGQAIG